MRLIKGGGDDWVFRGGYTVAQATRGRCGRCAVTMIGYGEPLCSGCSKHWIDWLVENTAALIRGSK